jgi:hypothetical protein
MDFMDAALFGLVVAGIPCVLALAFLLGGEEVTKG